MALWNKEIAEDKSKKTKAIKGFFSIPTSLTKENKDKLSDMIIDKNLDSFVSQSLTYYLNSKIYLKAGKDSQWFEEIIKDIGLEMPEDDK
jgi:hypothetical protein